MQSVISIISLILTVAQFGSFPKLNSALPAFTDWYPRLDPSFIIMPIVFSIIFVLVLYLPPKHRYDDFIKDDSKYKKWFWLSLMVSVISSFLVFLLTNSEREMPAVVICLIFSIIGSMLSFRSIAAIVRRIIPSPSLRHYPLSFLPF
jgi:Na+/melibiose symporter-like transporter